MFKKKKLMWYRLALNNSEDEIPSGAVRRFHYTSTNDILDKIAEEGILIDKSESYKYGDPKAVWSNPKFTRAPSVEFWEYPENIIGNQYQFKDVEPNQIIKLHYTWSDLLKYILENYGVYEGIKQLEEIGLTDTPDYKEVYEKLLQLKNSKD